MKIISKIKPLFSTQSYKELNRYALGYRRKILWLTLLTLTESMIGIAMALVTKTMIDFAVNKNIQMAIIYGIIFAILLFAVMLLSSYVSYYTVRITETLKNKMQLELLKNLYEKQWLELNRFKTGDLLTRLYSDITNVLNVLLSTIPTLISLFVSLILSFAVLLYYDPLLATLTFLITPVTIIISMLIGRKLKVIQAKIQIAESNHRSLVNESLQNMLVLKTFEFLSQNLKTIHDVQNNRFVLLKQKNIISIKANLILGLGYRLGFFGAVAFGAFRLYLDAITFGTFAAFLQLVGQIQGPIQGLSHSIPQLVSSMSSLDRINELNGLASEKFKLKDSVKLNLIPNSIEFKNLTFSYKENQKVLEQVNLSIHRGEKIAIVGASGEGKTTFIHLLLSLITPITGEIIMHFDQHPSELIDISTRTYFSYVPQTNSLFSGSIYENFLLKEAVNEEAINTALIASCSYDFVTELPDGIHTVLSERGIGLSQGQAQRLTIARALLHNKPYLIFDEATSALDLETEKQLIENMKHYYPNTTLIAVTHRESILEICEKVYRIGNHKLSSV